jgi:alkylhydroperoxidase/carboxymuconolactone decarboxylase family protein YurZ
MHDAVFTEMAQATTKALWDDLPALTTREKLLLSLVADVCQGTLGKSFEQHVLAAEKSNVPPDDLRELLRFIAYDSGYPAAATALQRLEELEQEHGLPTPTGEGHDLNLDGTTSPIPAQTRQAVTNLDEGFANYMNLQSRMRTGMQRLTVKERAFATMTVDILYQTLAESFETHTARALRAGATEEELRAVVTFSAMFGMTKAWRAMRALNTLLTGTGTVLP